MTLSKRERFTALVAGLILGALLLDRAVFSPLLQRFDAAGAELNDATAALTDAEALFDKSQRARRRWRELAGDSLRADPSAAESQLLNRVRDWAQAAGLTLTSLKPERIEREKEYQKLTIRATANATLSQAARFLYSIESADIPVRVTDLQLTARRDGNDDLTLQLGVATIFLPPETNRPAAGNTGGPR